MGLFACGQGAHCGQEVDWRFDSAELLVAVRVRGRLRVSLRRQAADGIVLVYRLAIRFAIVKRQALRWSPRMSLGHASVSALLAASSAMCARKPQ